MPDFMINGVPVSFPYEPYSVQTAYMEKVIECLKLGVNGMLESPTGTGKTLSLLCASLSWLTLKKAQLQAEAHGTFQLPNGDFVSGLQDSLRQAAGPANTSEPGCTSWGLTVQELKKAGFGHMKVSVLGSRDQLCIHPEVSTAQGNSIKNSIIILDEAHNIEKICEESVSVAISSTDVALCIQQITQVHVSVEENKSNKASSDSWGETKTKKGKEKFVNLMCFTPSFGMKQLLESNVRCIILTSGTLSPLPPLVSELSIPMPITLENPHVIGPGQVFVSIVTNGPDGTPLNSSFSTRNDPKYIASLGNTILNACRVVPHGVLPIFVESKSKEVFANTMTDYYNAVQDPKSKGACFFAVTRGKVSEGLDFMDVNGRAVIVTGLPYPPMMDAYVKLDLRTLLALHHHYHPTISHRDTVTPPPSAPQPQKCVTIRHARPESQKVEETKLAIMGRHGKPSAKENAPEPEAPGSDRFLTDIYNQDPHREIKPEKKIDLFKALEKQTTVIDFNDVSAASSCKSLFKWDDQIKEPKAKKE
ncbi:hypothetical protein C0J52_20730 [Blattella germanica]|nr:hypothetical protein C0J52_20730 [Blattella germanica]